MRLLLVTDGLDGAHLAPSNLWLGEVARRLARRGHAVHAVCTRPLELWQSPDDHAGVTVSRAGVDGAEAALSRAMERRPDAILLASATGISRRAVDAMAGVPVLLDAHDFWPICPTGDLMHRPRFTPCAEHFPFTGCGACAGLIHLRAMATRVVLARLASEVIVHRRFARARVQAALHRPVEFIDSGVDTLRFRPDPRAPLSPEVAALWSERGAPRVLFLGPPSHGRGVERIMDLVVAVHARCPAAEFVLAGRDVENPDAHTVVMSEAREAGLVSRLHVLPSVPVADLPALIGSCWVAVAPGEAPDATGVAVLQAMASGLPLVAHPAEGVSELIADGREGFLIRGDDIGTFAHAVVALLETPEARVAMGSNARLAAIERHDIERSVVALEARLMAAVRTPESRPAAPASAVSGATPTALPDSGRFTVRP